MYEGQPQHSSVATMMPLDERLQILITPLTVAATPVELTNKLDRASEKEVRRALFSMVESGVIKGQFPEGSRQDEWNLVSVLPVIDPLNPFA